MKTGSGILLDGLLYFIVYGNLLAVYNFFYSLAILVLAGNLSGYGNFLEVILLTDCRSDKSLCDLANFLSLSFGCYDLTICDKSCYLTS